MQLINGNFSSSDALDLVTQMTHVKIKFLEAKINKEHNEEDLKVRERRIIELQRDLYESRNFLTKVSGNINVHAEFILTA